MRQEMKEGVSLKSVPLETRLSGNCRQTLGIEGQIQIILVNVQRRRRRLALSLSRPDDGNPQDIRKQRGSHTSAL